MSKEPNFSWSLPAWLRGSRRRIEPEHSPALPVAPAAPTPGFAHADNTAVKVHALLRPMLSGERCLLVTGYQDFLSALALLIELRPGLAEEGEGTIRLVFGTNTETSSTIPGRSRPLREEARLHYLGQSGLALAHHGDLVAVRARDAIARGALQIRVYDQEAARTVFDAPPAILHAKLYVGESASALGSANFSRNGLLQNLEVMEGVRADEPSFAARREIAERVWRCGIDWSTDALEILDGLLRVVTPQHAVARVIDEMHGFGPWRIDGNRQNTERLPLSFQSELVYEAAATVYEHGFTFIEAPTGAGKTDIGKHLGATLAEMHRHVVHAPLPEIPSDDEAQARRSGSFAVVPSRVRPNWESRRPSDLAIVSLGTFSKDATASPEEMRDLERRFEHSAAVVIDECHRMSSRFLGASRRSETFEESPAIWSACLSATLLGNHGLDSLLAFHERRASLFMSPAFTAKMNAVIANERTRSAGFDDLEIGVTGQLPGIPAVGTDFGRGKDRKRGKGGGDVGGLVISAEAQRDLAAVLAPIVCRRNRACIGESGTPGDLRYPLVSQFREAPKLTKRQRAIIAEIVEQVGRISGGRILSSAELSRLGTAHRSAHDIERITIRNLLALLRASPQFATWSWHHAWGKGKPAGGDPDLLHADDGRSFAQRLRDAEARVSRRRPGQLLLPGIVPTATPICDRIETLLGDKELLAIENGRIARMVEILDRHAQVIFLSERRGVLQFYAERLQQAVGSRAKVMAVLSGSAHHGLHQDLFGNAHPSFTRLDRGDRAQEHFAIDGIRRTDGTQALFLTYEMAEGVNLQQAQALCLIDVTSNIRNMVQGLGRIDRIDSPHCRIAYYTFELPGVTLRSDAKAAGRMRTNMIGAGAIVGHEGGAGSGGASGEDVVAGDGIGVEEYLDRPAGELTDEIIAFKHAPRVLRREHLFDAFEILHQGVPADVVRDVRAARPAGVWGAELCLLRAADAPFTAVLLAGRAPRLGAPDIYLPPRLVVIAGDEVVSGQVECANMLLDAYEATRAAGLDARSSPMSTQLAVLEEVQAKIATLRHWDIRPDRTVSLLASLAAFLAASEEGREEDDLDRMHATAPDLGAGLFGDLTLPTLEYLADQWLGAIGAPWILAKRRIREVMRAQGETPDYLGIEAVMSVFRAGDPKRIEAVRSRMHQALARARAEAEGKDIGLADRVAVVFRAT